MSLTVFLEVYLALALTLIAIREFTIVEALVVFGVYSLGGAFGSVIPLLKKGCND